MGRDDMKDEYDFSKGERGKFNKPGVQLNVPVYLDEEVRAFVQDIADAKQRDVSTVVNDLLRADMRLAETLKQSAPRRPAPSCSRRPAAPRGITGGPPRES
jgi:hypothetical protein